MDGYKIATGKDSIEKDFLNKNSIMAKTMKFKIILFIVSLSWFSLAQAYPWMFFREDKAPGIMEWDTRISLFEEGQATVFSGIQLEYHHPTIDLNLAYTYSFLETSHYFRFSELALVFPFLFEEWKLILGFKDILWSEADKYWNYGLWQARYMLDPFRPVQMGLPGAYLSYKGDTSLLFLFSYFYFPDVIIYPQLKGNQISSKNPLFVNSFQNFHWKIDKIKLFQLERFFKPVVAFQLKHSLKNSNVALSYAYKPINQFQYNVSVQGPDLKSPKKKWIINDFNYSILSHHLFTVEGEAVLAKSLSLFASLFYEKPEKKQKKDWISNDFEPHLSSSLLAYFQENWGEQSKTLFSIGWTKKIQAQSNTGPSNHLAKESLEKTLGRNFDWKEAFSASMEYQNKNLFQGFLFRFRANYVLDDRSYILSLENYLYWTPQIRFYLSGDAIFSFSATKSQQGLAEKYIDKDRLLVGAQYVF